MESALHRIYALDFVSGISLIRFLYVKSGRPHFKIITIHFIEVSMDVAQPRSQILSFPHAKGKEKDPGSSR